MPRIAELPAPEVAARSGAGAVVLLPMGSTETHGPGAPMGDYLLAEQIALLAATRADALVAPALPFGGEDFFAGVPGGVALTHGTLSALLREVMDGLIAEERAGQPTISLEALELKLRKQEKLQEKLVN